MTIEELRLADILEGIPVGESLRKKDILRDNVILNAQKDLAEGG